MTNSKLSERCRRNLKALWREFHRCSTTYLPLYHESLVPWSEAGIVIVSDDEWAAFQKANPDNSDADEDWWQWDGPHYDPWWLGSRLDRFFGSSDGLSEFVELVESLRTIVNNYPVYVNRIDGYDDWTGLLHRLAFSHQMPLLRSEMSVWGCSDHPRDEDFYEVLEERTDREPNSISFPVHPLVWRLTFNLFTSSMTAIEAFLRPEHVITTNEPFEGWPGLERTVGSLSTETGESSAAADAKTVINSWTLLPNGFLIAKYHEDKKEGLFSSLVGFRRWAELLNNPCIRFDPRYLARDDEQIRTSSSAISASREQVQDAIMSGKLSVGRFKPDYTFDDDTLRDIKREADRLKLAKATAEAAGDTDQVLCIQSRLEALEERVAKDKDELDRPRRLGGSDWERGRKAVWKTLEVAREAISKQMPALAKHLLDCLESRGGYEYVPPPHCKWHVVEMKETR